MQNVHMYTKYVLLAFVLYVSILELCKHMQVACVEIARFMRTLFFAWIAVHISNGLSDN